MGCKEKWEMRLRYDAEADVYDDLYSDEQRIKYELALHRIAFSCEDRIILADYSSNDDFNSLMDDLHVRVLGKGRDMFRLSPEAMSILVQRAGLKVSCDGSEWASC